MTITPSRSLGVAVCVLIASLAMNVTPSASSAWQQPSSPAAPADDEALPLFVRICNECHDATRIITTRRTKFEWQDTILKMIEKGAKGSGQEFETVFGYVVRHYGKVYINDAPADEIAEIVGLSSKDAEAVVAFRTASGPFEDFGAVKKVPGIDVQILEAHQDAVAF